MSKEPLDIKQFGGINSTPARQPGQPSTGKNFRTKNGVLFTREGCSVVADTPFTNPIRSIHSAGKSQMVQKLLVEEGSKLWVYDGIDWTEIKSDVNGNGYCSTQWSSFHYGDFLILVSGNQMIRYDISTGDLRPLDNLETGTSHIVPSMEFVTTFHGFLFGWSPNFAPANWLKYNGYETIDNVKYKSTDYWPPVFALDPSSIGETILGFIPFDTHALAITNKAAYRIYGENEETFSPSLAARHGMYAKRCVAKVGEVVLWLGLAEGRKKVYAYTGSDISSIGDRIEDELNSRVFTDVFAYGFGERFYLFMPSASDTKVFVFDVNEKEWYIDIYPFVITSVCSHGEYSGREYLYLGLSDGRLLKVGGTQDLGTAITTEFVLGPVQLGRATSKAKVMWLTAEPDNDFNINIYAQGDNNDEQGPFAVSFVTGEQISKRIKLKSIARGSEIKFRLTSTDNVSKLIDATIIVVPKGLK